MRETQLPFPELSLIAATRGILGAGVGFLLADLIPGGARKTLGWTLLSIGALSTIPLALTVFGRSRCQAYSRSRAEGLHDLQRESDERVREQGVAVGV